MDEDLKEQEIDEEAAIGEIEEAAAAEAADDYQDKWRRTLAEFDNFRKRTAREKANMYDDGVMGAVSAILPVLDNLERALATSGKEGALYEGLEKTLKQAAAALDALGVSEIDALHNPFDPNLHEAVMHGEDDALGEQTVAEVFQKGYACKGRVIRHSMVKVAN